MKKMKANTQKESLNNEIKDLKMLTDHTLEEAVDNLNYIEKLQKNRKTSDEFFTSMMPSVYAAINGHTREILTSGYCSANTSVHHLMVPSKNEPQTAITRSSALSSSSIIQCSRYKSQGPMRSEKVYQLTNILTKKNEELAHEKVVIDDRFKIKDIDNEETKKDLAKKYNVLKQKSADCTKTLEDKDDELERLDQLQKEIANKYEKLLLNLKDHIEVIKMGQ